MMISKIELKCFQINLMLELFMCWRLKLLELFKKIYSSRMTFYFFKFLVPIFWQVFFFVVYIFLWICIIFSIFFQTKIAKLKIQNQKNMLVGGTGC